MTLNHEAWLESLRAVADGSSGESARSLLDDPNGPPIGLRWGGRIGDDEALDYFVAICKEMRTSKISARGNDALTKSQLDSLHVLIGRLSHLVPEFQGHRGVSLIEALRGAQEVMPYLEPLFVDMEATFSHLDPAYTA